MNRLNFFLVVMSLLVEISTLNLCEQRVAPIPMSPTFDATNFKLRCRACQNNSDVVTPADPCVYCAGICLESNFFASLGQIHCVDRKRSNCAIHDPVTMSTLTTSSETKQTTSLTITSLSTSNSNSLPTFEPDPPNTTPLDVVSTTTTTTTTKTSLIQVTENEEETCTMPGQTCGLVDSPLELEKTSQLLCANRTCICNFILIYNNIVSTCVYSGADFVRSITNNGVFDNQRAIEQCEVLRRYRECVFNMLGSCASVKNNWISNTPNGCGVKWQKYICQCKSSGGFLGPLCYTGDKSACEGGNPTALANIDKYCPGGCSVPQPNTSNSLMSNAVMLFLAFVLAKH